jgi:hypothetical protein
VFRSNNSCIRSIKAFESERTPAIADRGKVKVNESLLVATFTVYRCHRETVKSFLGDAGLWAVMLKCGDHQVGQTFLPVGPNWGVGTIHVPPRQFESARRGKNAPTRGFGPTRMSAPPKHPPLSRVTPETAVRFSSSLRGDTCRYRSLRNDKTTADGFDRLLARRDEGTKKSIVVAVIYVLQAVKAVLRITRAMLRPCAKTEKTTTA